MISNMCMFEVVPVYAPNGVLWRCAVLKDPETRGLSRFSGGLGEGETPLPIPNREVKPLSADGTWLARAWESRTPPVSSAAHTSRPIVRLVLVQPKATLLSSSALSSTVDLDDGPVPIDECRLPARGHPTNPTIVPGAARMCHMSRFADFYARISPKLAHRPGSTVATRLHARIHRATRGEWAVAFSAPTCSPCAPPDGAAPNHETHPSSTSKTPTTMRSSRPTPVPHGPLPGG